MYPNKNTVLKIDKTLVLLIYTLMTLAFCTSPQETPGKQEVAKSVRVRMAHYKLEPAKPCPGDPLEPSTGDLLEPSTGDMLEPNTGDLLDRVPVCRSVTLHFYDVHMYDEV